MEFRCGPGWDERIVSIDPKSNPAILLSSGMDSSTILGIFACGMPNVKFRVFNVQTSDDPNKPEIDAILKFFGLDIELEIVGTSRRNWPMKSHYPRLCLAFQEIRDTTDVGELYCGNILTPHPQFFPRWNVDQKGIAKRPWLTSDSFLKNPFEHIEKYHVLDLGRRYGFDDVYDLTTSCNVYANDHCGDCMGCKELDWAYNQLDSERGVDLDTMTAEAVMKYGDIGW
jgi:hypothetical protein